jgi:ubiquinone/menaquinone biosynthesis C-methylase UbiE
MDLRYEAQQAQQRDYYSRTAADYDTFHNHGVDDHQFALAWLKGVIELFEIKSVLDIGSGTGRALLTLKQALPDLRVVGVEPSEALREQGYAKGLREDELVSGDARALAYVAGEFDVVCAFGAMHHIPDPAKVVGEMLRVARVGVFISDANKFGQGPALKRRMKRLLRRFGLWGAYDYVRTRGKGYMISEGDGLFYSYSVFDNYQQISDVCPSVHIMNTQPSGPDIYRTSPVLALLGLKQVMLINS